MLVRVITAVAILIFASLPASAKRVALVIGNGAYQNAVELPNPVNDAKALATKLRDLNFEVVAGYDQDHRSMLRTVANFAKAARKADIALLFYAGHGMQVRGNNYLIPIDARFEDETALDFETISMDFIIRQMSNDVRVRMVFLDACRDNPLARTLARQMSPSRSASIGVGLAEIEMDDGGGEGSVIAFATSPGDVALDGEDRNSPFTKALLRHIDAPNTPIQSVMTRVTGDVYRETEERQRPWVNASLIGEVFLNKVKEPADDQRLAALGDGATAAPAAAPAAAAPAAGSVNVAWDREKTLFEFAREGNTIRDYEAYLAAYPNGHFADIAKISIDRLTAKAGTQAVASVDPAVAATTPDTAGGAPAASAPTGIASAGAAPAPGTVPGAVGAVPSITDAVRSVPGTEVTEAELNWDRAARREVQVRLELAGQELGRPDGVFGPKTRSAVRAWQTANSIIPTGYFTPSQYQALVSQTSEAFVAYEVEQKAARAARSRSAGSNRRQTTTNRRTGSRNNDGGVAGAAFIGGVVGGVVGGLIGR